MSTTTTKLASGAELVITTSPFAVAKDLYQAVLEELKGVKIDPTTEVDFNLFKDLMCVGFSSKKIEKCLWACLERVTYNGLKVTLESFEPDAARGDYVAVCAQVVQENISPFMKSLYAQYAPLAGTLMQKDPA